MLSLSPLCSSRAFILWCFRRFTIHTRPHILPLHFTPCTLHLPINIRSALKTALSLSTTLLPGRPPARAQGALPLDHSSSAPAGHTLSVAASSSSRLNLISNITYSLWTALHPNQPAVRVQWRHPRSSTLPDPERSALNGCSGDWYLCIGISIYSP